MLGHDDKEKEGEKEQLPGSGDQATAAGNQENQGPAPYKQRTLIAHNMPALLFALKIVASNQESMELRIIMSNLQMILL